MFSKKNNKLKNNIAFKNIIGRPARSIMLIIIAAFLSVSIFAGAVISIALRNGFSSLESRLGADIMVVPYEASSKSKLENIVLQGNTGYFYMDSKYLDEISEIEGVDRISEQYYLASVNAGCCSASVEIIGFDPETDFSIQPWIKKSKSKDIGYLDVVVGNDLNAFVGDTLSFFGVKVNVIAKLDKTGTSYDTTVFTTRETITKLIDASLDKQLNTYAGINSGNIVSNILIDVKDGYSIEEVLNDINIHYKKLKAVRTTNLISGVAEGLSGVSKVATIVVIFVWVIALMIMAVSFVMITNMRKKEFAVLRAIGASGRRLFGIVMEEGLMISLVGSIAGVIIGMIIIIPFSGFIEQSLGLPYLLPSAGVIILISLMSVLLSVLAGRYQLSKQERFLEAENRDVYTWK